MDKKENSTSIWQMLDRAYTVLLILGVIITVTLTVGNIMTRLSAVEEKVDLHTTWIDTHKKEVSEAQMQNIKTLNRIENYLQRLCEKDNINYKESK